MNLNQVKANSEKNMNTLINKCWEDDSFKQQLIANPAKAIEQLSNKPFDAKGKKIVVNDQSDPSTFYINIPKNVNDMELSEAELEAVAGGRFSLTLAWSLICISWG